MNDRERMALEAVVDYLWDDESRDYDEQDEHGKDNHILNSLQVLKEMVER